MGTALVYDDCFLDHDTGPLHPERPQRLEAIVQRLRDSGLWDRLCHLPIEPAPDEAILAVHDPAYITRLRSACEHGRTFIDSPDSAICTDSYEVARLAAGGVLAAAEAVMRGRGAHDGKAVRNAFCAVRPPGHHAERDLSMGFCLLNHIALAAEHLIRRHDLQRIAIVDFDVHHGNGTQHTFDNRPEVLFVSIHEHPSYQYPGTGFAWEKGKGGGAGLTLNIPLDPHSGDEEYRQAFLRKVLPALDHFKPQFLLLSAGFDASEFDPLGHMQVTADGFAWMTRQLKAAAERHCHGRLVSILEGGYDLRSLAECVARHVEVLLQPDGHDDLMAAKAGM